MDKTINAASGGRLVYVVNVDWFFLSHRLELARAARREGYEVHVLTADTGRLGEIQAEGFDVVAVPFARSFTHPLRELCCLWLVWRTLRRLKPRVVHCVALKAVLIGGLACFVAAPPRTVFTVTGVGSTFLGASWKSRAWRGLVRWALRTVFSPAGARVILQNGDDLREFIGAGVVPREKAVLIRGSGVDLERFQPAPEPPETDGFVVVLPARLLKDKGVREFAEAGRILREAGRFRVRMILAGGEDLHNTSALDARIVQEWVRKGWVEWPGFQNDMATVYRSAHLVAFPSYREGLPRALLEAGACGRATVATDVPGCREVIREGVNGLLVPARDASALARAIGRLLGDPDLRRDMGRKARQIVEQEFGLPRVIERTLETYHPGQVPLEATAG